MKIGWKGAVALAAILAAAGAGSVRYGEWVASFADGNLRVDIPLDLTIQVPAAEIPTDIAGFAGVWAGDRVDGGPLPVALAVERVNSGGWASVVYAWGADQEKHARHGWFRRRGRIVAGHLHLAMPDGSELDASIGAGDRLLVRLTHANDWRSYALLTRVGASDLVDILASAGRRSEPLWQEIAVPERSAVGEAAGSTVTLRATLYRAGGAGRHPMVIFNPGSGDLLKPGDTVRDEAPARLFLSLGYGVVVPMRKGRGGSSGPLIEGRDFAGPPEPEVQIESGIEDIDAVVSFMRQQDYVDPDRIVVAGNQHGGLLAIAYAGRHPDKVAAAVDIAGGWWPQAYRDGRLDTEILAAAGSGMASRAGGVRTLWLYAESDARWPLPQAERNFAAFCAAGGSGRFIAFPDPSPPGIYRSQLFDWTAKWEDAVGDFLRAAATSVHRPEPPGVGVVLLDVSNPLEKGRLPVAVFYPSPIAEREIELGAETITAVDRAPIEAGRFPLVLISPFYGGDRFSQHDTAEALARAGFIVVTLTHPDEDADKPEQALAERALLGRPYDLRAALDAVLAEPLLAERVDRARIGVAGFGLGGFAALVLAGGRPDLARLPALCEARLDPGCGKPVEAPAQGLVPTRDGRIKGLVLLVPSPGYLFDDGGLRGVTVPVRLYRATGDRGPAAPYDAPRIRTLLSVPPDEVEIVGARASAFHAPCTPTQRETAPDGCIDPPGISRIALHARLDAEIAAFFERALPAADQAAPGDGVSGR
jgi:predicted dienelactone hydrolase